MGWSALISQRFHESLELKEAVLAGQGPAIVAMGEALIDCLRRGGKLLLAGNGGSAADAQHLAAELVNRFLQERPALAAIALTTDSSILTATANDRAYEEVFSRQVEALGGTGDALLLISTSGRSPNLARAAQAAHGRQIRVLGLLGGDGGSLLRLCDEVVLIPPAATPRVQEAQILVGHILCEMIEKGLFPEEE